MNRETAQKTLVYFAITLGAVPIMIPFLWMLATSMKTNIDAAEHPSSIIPNVETTRWKHDNTTEIVTKLIELLDGTTKIKSQNGTTHTVRSNTLWTDSRVTVETANYARLTNSNGIDSDTDWPRFLANTLLIASMTVIGQVLSCSLTGWGFARLSFAFKNQLFVAMLATMMVPVQISMVPVFMIYRWLGWIDTFLPLIVPAWLGGAFFTFLYRQYFMAIPREMDEAAEMDGCSPIQTYWNVLLPMAKPVTVTVGVYSFLGAWNEFMGPLIYINSDYKRTLTVALAKFQGAYSSDIPMLMAASTLMLIPVLLLYLFSQRFLIQGMTVSGVKG